ncbi:MAG: TIGR04283 family arsenosugar biosynthesis glycosyltransferase [Planctomycetota bacterium]
MISIVIPTLNEHDGISRCVRSAWDAGAGEVIVADGGSDDGTQEIAAEYGAACVQCERRGRGHQLNQGAARTRGEILLFLHADNWLEPTSLTPLCEISDDPEEPQAPACPFWGALRQRIQAPGWAYRGLEWGNAWRVRWRRMPFGDQAVFVHRQLWDQVGGFPEVPLMEDVRLAMELRKLQLPELLAGPVNVDARRWQKRGVAKQMHAGTVHFLWKAGGMAANRVSADRDGWGQRPAELATHKWNWPDVGPEAGVWVLEIRQKDGEHRCSCPTFFCLTRLSSTNNGAGHPSSFAQVSP